MYHYKDVKHYKLLEASSAEELEKLVNLYLDRGFHYYGYPHVNIGPIGVYTQAMTYFKVEMTEND